MAAMALGNCQPSQDAGNTKLLDQIERSVALPAGAGPLESYSRYFAPDGKGNIEALYVVHSRQFVDDAYAFCQSRQMKAFPCGERPGTVELAQPGHRKWLDDARDLPIPDGGGCGAIRFSYDLATAKASIPRCNGPY